MAKSSITKKEKRIIPEKRIKVPTDCRICFYSAFADYGLFYCNCIRVGRITPQPNCLENNIECFYFKNK